MITPAIPAYTTKNDSSVKPQVYVVSIRPSKSGLIGAWRLNEASGDREDYLGNNTFQDFGGTLSASGKVSTLAASFNGGGSLLKIPVSDNHALAFSRNADFTIHLWTYLTAKAADSAIASQWDLAVGSAVDDQSWILRYNQTDDRFEFRMVDVAGTQFYVQSDVLGSPSINTWYWLLVEYDSVTGGLSIAVNNGSPDITYTDRRAIHSSLHDIRIGSADFGSPLLMYGRVEQFCMWKKKLSTSQKSTLYNSGSGKDIAWLFEPDYRFSNAKQNPETQPQTTPYPSLTYYGRGLLDLGELEREADIENSRFSLAKLSFELIDKDGEISEMVTAGVEGYDCDLYQTFWDVGVSGLTKLFSGTLTEIEAHEGAYAFTARSYLAAAQDKIIFAGAESVLVDDITDTATTLNIEDGSTFPDASDEPQSYRRLIMIDDEIASYRGLEPLEDGTWILTDVIRSAPEGYPISPFFGAPADHKAGATVKYIPKLGSLIPETSHTNAAWTNVEVNTWMHIIEYYKQILSTDGPDGLGEYGIPLNVDQLDDALREIGPPMQCRGVFPDSAKGKEVMEEEILSICAAVPTENNLGQVGIKLFKTSKLKAAFPFSEEVGIRLDAANSGMTPNYNLTPAGTPTRTAGKVAFAVEFNGVDQYLWRPVQGLQCANCTFLLAGWLYLNSKTGTMTIASQYDVSNIDGQSWKFAYNHINDRLQFHIYDGSGGSSGKTFNSFGSPATGTWIHFVVGYLRDSREIAGVFNGGSIDGSGSITSFIPAATLEEFRIGASGDGSGATQFLDGKLAELGVFMNEEDIQGVATTLYNSGTGLAIDQYDDTSHDPVDTFTDAHVFQFPKWLRNSEKQINRVVVHYDQLPDGSYGSTFECRDDDSIRNLGREITLELNSSLLRSRFTEGLGYTWFDYTYRFLHDRCKAMIERFGRKSPRIAIESMMKKHLLEVADDVQSTFSRVLDLSNGSLNINAADMEIAYMRHDFRANGIDVELLFYPILTTGSSGSGTAAGSGSASGAATSINNGLIGGPVRIIMAGRQVLMLNPMSIGLRTVSASGTCAGSGSASGVATAGGADSLGAPIRIIMPRSVAILPKPFKKT